MDYLSSDTIINGFVKAILIDSKEVSVPQNENLGSSSLMTCKIRYLRVGRFTVYHSKSAILNS